MCHGTFVQFGWDTAFEATASQLTGEQTGPRDQVTKGLFIK